MNMPSQNELLGNVALNDLINAMKHRPSLADTLEILWIL
jgi:hypothetical protein